MAHLITLGEPVYQVIRERYALDNLPAKKKDVLEEHREKPPMVKINGKNMSLLPLPHYFNIAHRPRWKFMYGYLRKLAMDTG
ncbi:hypothetical protein ACFLXC_06775 [Chloroflexota bacterium]